MPSHTTPLATPVLTPSRVGLGGEGILRTVGREPEAQVVINEALLQGLTYFDSAAAYAGSQAYFGSVWRDRADIRARIFQTTKSAAGTRAEAEADLENSLRTLNLDYVDLWQIHDLRTTAQFEQIAGTGGALEAFVRAREQGKARFIGVTGHHDPDILTRAVLEWPVDSVLLPVNPVEACLGGFLDRTIPAAKEKGLAVIAMKVLGASHYLAPQHGASADHLIRFALCHPVDHVIVGCRVPEHVAELARAGRDEEPLAPADQEKLVELFRPQSRELAFYRGWI